MNLSLLHDNKIFTLKLLYFSATSFGRFVLLRILKTKYPDLEFIKSMSIRSAMDTPDNKGYIVVLLKVNGDFDIDLMKQTIKVHLFIYFCLSRICIANRKDIQV